MKNLGLLALLFLAGCNYQVKKEAGGGGTPPSSKPTVAVYFADVQPILERSCVKCHEEFANYAGVMGAVHAGNSASSELFTRLKNNGGDMPKRANAIPNSEAEIIRAWIDGGALLAESPAEPKPEPTPTPTSTPAPPAVLTFADVQPVLNRACVKCHEEFADYDTLMKSKTVVAGHASASELFTRLKNNGGDMPKKANAIPDTDAALIRDWIEGGALKAASAEPSEPAPAPKEPAPSAPQEPQPLPVPAPAPAPAELATFSQLESQVFSKKCTMCHGETSLAAGFSLATYDGFANNARVIVKGKSADSGLYVSVAGADAFMPPKRAVAAGKVQPLTEDEKLAVKTWIDNGALNN